MQNLQKSALFMTSISMIAALFVFTSAAPVHSYADPVSFSDTEGHWAQSYITWAIDEQLTEGYGDGSFQPNRLINEAEFLAMLLRAYSLVPATSIGGDAWYKPYYDFAAKLGWPVTYVIDSGKFRRGQAALILASAATGKAYTEQTAIQWLLDEDISTGRTSATVSGYEPNGLLTRAEALTFFYKLKLHTNELSNAKIPTAGTSVNGISIDDTEEKLTQLLGEPDRRDGSELGFSWYIYNDSYASFKMIGVQDGEVTALFTNSSSAWQASNGIKLGQTIAEAKKLTGTVSSAEAQDDYYSYTFGDVITTLFIDRLDGNKIIGILQMKQGAAKSAYSSKLQSAFEQQTFDLTNAERTRRSIAAVQWDKLAAAAARAHSNDMLAQSFFSHSNPDGLSPFDRMKNKGIVYTTAAENIAAGYTNSIYAHYGWMNSTDGHRETILDSKLKRLGTGVSFGGSYKVYYTQDFYTP